MAKNIPISMIFTRGIVGSANLTRPPIKKAPSSIDTVAGKAFFIKTEVEDESGRWHDDYWTRDGYYVIHEGRRHHVYKLGKVI